MALSCGRTACRPGAPAASRSAAPAVQRPSVASRAVVVRTEKEDAVRALEKQATGLRAALGGPDPSMVTVTPMATRTMESVASMGSMDGTGLMSLDKDTFWPYLKAQGSTLTVVDFYTDWCGPCKLIYPELVKLSQARTDVRFVKVNCNKTNKDLGVALAIKVAPTFHLYRNSTKVAEMTGAKVEKLVALINQHQPPAADN